jgi:hypothetical protein
MARDQTTEEPDAAKVARPVLKSGGRGDPLADFNLLALRMWGMPGIALVGSHLRHDRLAQLDRFERLYVALDPDEGGRKGTQSLITYFGSRIVPIELPDGDDVGKLAMYQDGEERFRTAIKTAFTSISAPELEPANAFHRPLSNAA